MCGRCRFTNSLKLFAVAVLLVSVLLSLPAGAFSQGPVISSQWTSTPPVIDGRFSAGEWSNLQIVIQGPDYPDSYVKPTFVYFMNDNSRLYALVDAAGDTTDDSLDECLLVFDFQQFIKVEIIGDNPQPGEFDAAAGFYASPNNSTAHKIYEFSISLSYINAIPGQSIEFSSPLSGKHPSMPYDSTTGHDNVWPLGLVEGDPETWSIFTIGERPIISVGGFIESVNKVSVLSPYLALFGLAAIVAVVFAKPWKRD